jgi:hypothetical protein
MLATVAERLAMLAGWAISGAVKPFVSLLVSGFLGGIGKNVRDCERQVPKQQTWRYSNREHHAHDGMMLEMIHMASA